MNVYYPHLVLAAYSPTVKCFGTRNIALECFLHTLISYFLSVYIVVIVLDMYKAVDGCVRYPSSSHHNND